MLDVQLYVARCHLCGRQRRGPKQKQGGMQKALGCAVMQKVHCDLSGPFPTSQNGYKYLLIVICSFSKFLICVPIRDKTSLTVAKALVKHVYLVYSAPELLVHDHGGEFWSDVMADLARLLGIHVSKITLHRPSSNGVCERVHSMLHTMLSKVVNNNQRNWCELTPYITYGYNTAYHSSTTFSPFFLMFLRRPRSTIELQLEMPSPAAPETTGEFVAEVSECMRQAYAVVRKELKSGFDRMKKRYDGHVKTACFKAGDLVWYYVLRGKRGLNKKWMLCNNGPYKVIRSINDVNKVVQLTPSAKPLIVHIDRLQHYTGEVPACWSDSTPAACKPADNVGVTISEPQPPVAPEPECTRQPGSRRAAGRPARFDDFICSLTVVRNGKMWQCSVCEIMFEMESGLRRHMPSHRLRYHSGGRLERMTDSEAEGVLQRSRMAQMNSRRRRRHRARLAAEGGAGAAPGLVVGPARERSPPQPGRLCLLTSYRPSGDESSSDEPIGLLRWDRQESDVGSGQDVDALFGPLWEAAGLPSLPTYTEAGAQTVNPPAEEAEVQAVPATSDVGLHLIPVPTRTVGLYTAGTSWADTLLRGMSVADVVQTITERLGESVPSIVARLAREGVSHNLRGFRRLFCLVATAARTRPTLRPAAFGATVDSTRRRSSPARRPSRTGGGGS